MASRMRIPRVLAVLAIIGVCIAWQPREALATHYPPGAKCYDCHAVSQSKMYTGTKMVKINQYLEAMKNDPIEANRWVPGQSIPCLFCHRANAVSVSQTVMKPVEAHFGTLAVSKHNAQVNSTFGGVTAAFECLDCHSRSYPNPDYDIADPGKGDVNISLSSGLSYLSTGDANIHGVNPSIRAITKMETLVNNGTVPTANTLHDTCESTTCHGGASDNSTGFGGRTAKKVHAYNNTTLGTSGTIPDDCSDCHATHRGDKQPGLMVLLKDGTLDPQDGVTVVPSSSFVTPSDCGSCHKNDDPGAGYSTSGHGKASGSTTAMNLTCSSCHTDTVGHSFGSAGDSNNVLRFKFTENKTAQSSIRQNAPYNQAYSICLTCHAQFANKLHKGLTATAGCNDCHEPHGNTTGTNAKMIRTAVPKKDAGGTAVYGYNSSTGTYETNTYASSVDSYRADNTGLCDNAECHQGRTYNGDAIYPLSTLMSGGAHTGADQTAGSDCKTCHSHTDSGGTFAASQSCTTCHGMPPVGTSTTAPSYTTISELDGPHKRHAATVANGGYNIPCQACHQKYADSTWHNTGTWNNTSQTFGNAANASYQTIYFDTALNSKANNTVTGSSPKDYAASYNTTTRACTDLYCHSSGVTTNYVNAKSGAGTGTDDLYSPNNTVQWNAAGWSTANLACDQCHGGIDTTNRIATGMHSAHLNAAATCNNCHNSTVTTVGTNSTTQIADTSVHVNRVKEVTSGGTFKSAAVTFSWNGTSCSAISCHGGWKSVAWNATSSCSNCHGYPPDGTLGSTDHGSSTNGTTNHTSYSQTIKDKHEICATCHGAAPATDSATSDLTVFKDLTAGGGDAYLASNHLDGKVQMNGISVPDAGKNTGYNANVAHQCAKACHAPGYVLNGNYATNVVELKEFGAGGCDVCHGGSGKFWPDGGSVGVDNSGSADDDGKHTIHITALSQRRFGLDLTGLVNDASSATKQKELCEYCHAAVTNDDDHTSGDAAEVFLANINTVSTRKSKSMADATDSDAAYATGNCTNVDCHNNKDTATTSSGWYTSATSTCTMCHSVGGSGNPTTGLHNAARISANPHDDSFKLTYQAVTNTANSCTVCHTMPTMASQSATHDNGVFNSGVVANLGLSTTGLTYSQIAAGTGTCALSGGLAGCHSDKGTWQRVWNSTAANNDGSECANCHGGLTTGYSAGSYVTGMSSRHGDPQIPGNHGTCDYCHEYNNGSTTPYNLGTMHPDDKIQLNASVAGDLGYQLNGTSPNQRIGCSNCHSASDDSGATFADGKHEFDMVTDDASPKWTRINLDGSTYDCSSCHTSNNATHANVGESATVHNTHTQNTSWISGCADCHANSGPGTGTGHADGTVSFGGTRMTTAFNYLLTSTNFTTVAGNCNTSANGCHDAAASTWTSPATITCANCHNAATSGTVDAGKIMDMGNYPPASGSHTIHRTTTTGGGAVCEDCHGANASAGTHTGHQNKAVNLAGAAAGYTGGLAITSGNSDGNNAGTCGTNSCHQNGQNGQPDVTPYNWGTAINGNNSCTECHGNTAPLMATQAHQAHLNANTTFGIAIGCSSCHGTSPETQTTHANGTINLSGFTYTGDVVVTTNGGTFGSCGANACHNDGQGATYTPALATYNWNTVQANCTICHQDLTAMTSLGHNKHTNNGYTAPCTDCHAAATAATHINGSTTFDAAKVTYSKGATFANDNTAAGTCTTVNCHNRGTTFSSATTSGAWNSGALACDACHYYDATPTGAENGTTAWYKLTAAHNDHFDRSKNCVNCHGAVPTDTTHITPKTTLQNGSRADLVQSNAVKNFTTGGDSYTFGTGDKSCYSASNNGLGCHATAGSAGAADASRPVWTTAFSDCTTYCHTNKTTAAVNPTSGLHSVVPSVTGQQHDESFGNGALNCSNCHNPNATAYHQNGTMEGDGGNATHRTAMAFTTNFSYSNTTDGTCFNTTASMCHDVTRNDWQHKWVSTTNYYTNATTACGGCHGDWTNGWNGNVTHRTSANTQSVHGDQGGNYQCYECHLIGVSTNYNFTFGTLDWTPLNSTTKHGNGSIEVNSNGTTYTSANNENLCRSCHTSVDGIHNFADTSWPINLVAGNTVTVACGSCHTGGVRPAANSGAHAAHGADAADLVDGGAACVDCHGNNGGLGYSSTPSGTHGVGSAVNFANVTYSQAASRGNLTGTCLTANCHNINTGTDQSSAWNNTELACDDCHYYAATTTATQAALTAYPAARRLSDDHGVHFGTGGTEMSRCSNCHGTDPVAADTTHINGTTSLTDKAVALQDEANVTAASWNDTANSCGSTTTPYNCHNPSGASYTAVWNTTVGSCSMCHAGTTGDPGTGDHTAHMTRSAVFGRAISCVDCHDSASYNTRHLSGTKNVKVRNTAGVFGAAISNALVAGACGTNECHNDGLGAAPVTTNYQWGVSSITDCLECHQNGTGMATNAHNEHMNTGYTGAACTDCHTAATATTHLDRNLTVNTNYVTLSGATGGSVALGTVNGTCTTVNCHNRGTTIRGDAASVAWNIATGTGTPGTNDLWCDSCHYYSATPASNTNTGWSALSTSHGDHFVKGKNCTQCHGAAITTTGHISNKTSMADGAVAALGESVNAVVFTDASAVTDYTYNGTTRVCSSPTNNGIGCHATAATADWDVAIAATDCTTYCHTDKTTAAVNPTSGLHSQMPSVTGQQHDESFGNGALNCSSCHNPSASYHQNGTMEGDGGNATHRTAMGFTTNFSYSNTTDGTCINTTTSMCHDVTRNDWQHKWVSTTNYYTNAITECGGCHGDWANGWNGNVTHRTSSGTQSTHGDQGTNYDCYECHVIESAAYPFTYGTNDWRANAGENTTLHGNGTIEINNNGTGTITAYSHSNNENLCRGCHTSSDGVHNYADTGWPISTAYSTALPISASCSGCHGDSANKYWPQSAATNNRGTTANSMFNDDGRHTKHVEDLAAKVYGETLAQLVTDTGEGTKDAKQKAICGYCHTVSDADHMNLVNATQAEVVISKSIWGAADSGTSFNQTNYNCAGVDCHNNKDTTTTYNWYTGAASACIMCHTPGTGNNPSSGLHNVVPSVSAQQHDNAFGSSSQYTCTNCHTAMPAYTKTSTHLNGSFEGGNGKKPEMSLGAMYTQTADNEGTCATTSCHAGQSDAWAHVWTTATTNYYTSSPSACYGCHGYDLAAGFNAGVTHRNTSGTLATHGDQGTNYDCYECHVMESASYPITFGSNDWKAIEAGTTLHGNGTIEINRNAAGTVTAYTFANNENLCRGCHTTVDGTHNFPDSSWPVSTAYSTANAISATCTVCHGDGNKELWPQTPNNNNRGTTTNAMFNDDGKHTKHIEDMANKIYGFTLTQLLNDAATDDKQKTICSYCHAVNPNDADHMSLVNATQAEVFPIGGKKGYDGSVDSDVTFNSSTYVCNNSDCHNNCATPSWYSTADTTPPTFSGITSATNANNGKVDLAWSAATDSSPPISYNVYWHTSASFNTSNWDANYKSTGVRGTSFTVGGLTNATAYKFGVRAVDAYSNIDTNTATATATPTVSSTSTVVITPASLNGTTSWAATGGDWSTVLDAIDTTAYGAITSTTAQALKVNMDSTGFTAGTINSVVITLNMKASKTTAGNIACSFGTISPNALPTSATAVTTNYTLTGYVTTNWAGLNAANVTITSGAATNNTTTVDQVIMTVTYTPPADSAAPVWASGSGIGASNVGTGSALNVSWNAATDASSPIFYVLYRSTGTVNPYTDASPRIYNATSIVDTGLTAGTAYNYGVRAKDPNNNTTTNTNYVSGVTPSAEAPCVACHDGTGTGAGRVGTSSSHMDADGSGGTYAIGPGSCSVCHFSSHSNSTVGTYAITWDTRTMGTSYISDSTIRLKKLAGTETGEAQICWNCHSGTTVPSINPVISEFGSTQGSYTTGTISQANWYLANWTSANFGYKTGAIRSVHRTRYRMDQVPSGGINTLFNSANVAEISCTSCHDVHAVGNNGYTPVGQPYLRGSWKSNPYKEDGAPLVGQTKSSNRGAVPRGIDSTTGPVANDYGGWQIEQNNATETTTNYTSDASGFGGLCAKCHSQTNLEGMTWKGHKGAVVGFTGSTNNDILNLTNRGGLLEWARGTMSYNNLTTYRSSTYVGGLRNNRQWADGIAPRDIDSLQTNAPIEYPYGNVTTITGPTGYQNKFHQFVCSKCHSPHASRLPRLMVTNCLDVSHNTWDDDKNPSSWAATSPKADTHLAKQLAYASTAQNCHRYVKSTDTNKENGSTNENGWNSVTPW